MEVYREKSQGKIIVFFRCERGLLTDWDFFLLRSFSTNRVSAFKPQRQ